MEASIPALGAAFVIMALAAAVQGTVGFGMNVIAVPSMALIDSDLAPVPQLLVALVVSVVMVAREHRHIDFHGVGWMLAGRPVGALLGLWLLKSFSDDSLQVAIAVLILAAVAALGSGWKLVRNPVTEFTTGVAAAISSLIASIGGPPTALLYRDAAGPSLRSSINSVFIVGIAITIAVRVFGAEIDRSDFLIAAVLLPAALLGIWGSRFLIGRVEGRRLRRAVLVLSALAALGLLIKVAF